MNVLGLIAGLVAGCLWTLGFGALQWWGAAGWGAMLGIPAASILLSWLYKPLRIGFLQWFTIGWLLGAAAFSAYIIASFALRFT